jgi:hypothetical protein
MWRRSSRWARDRDGGFITQRLRWFRRNDRLICIIDGWPTITSAADLRVSPLFIRGEQHAV